MNIQSVCLKDRPIKVEKGKPSWWNREIRKSIKRIYFKILVGRKIQKTIEILEIKTTEILEINLINY